MLATPERDKEQSFLDRLSVFEGGWATEAAEAVCAGGGVEAAEVRGVLKQLVDKSLLIAQAVGGEARYRFSDATRHEGTDKLEDAEEAAALRRQHRDWYLAKRRA